MSPGRAFMTALMTSAIFAGATGIISVFFNHPVAGFAPVLAAIAGFVIALVIVGNHHDEFTDLKQQG